MFTKDATSAYLRYKFSLVMSTSSSCILWTLANLLVCCRRELCLQALLVVKLTILSWEYDWVYNGLEEFVTMIILVHLGTTFAPLDPWLLTRGFDHSLEQDTS